MTFEIKISKCKDIDFQISQKINILLMASVKDILLF